MKYQCRPGIVRVKICGVYILVPTHAVSESCTKAMQLSLMGASLWGELEKGNDGSKIVSAIQILTRKPQETAQTIVDNMLDNLYQKGFLIKV